MRATNWLINKLKNFRRCLKRRKFFIAAAILSIVLTLFLGWFSQFLFISEFLKRANAELAVPIVGYEYSKDRDEASARKELPEITILKVTDADLNAAKESYPPSHRFHARKMEKLRFYGTPKALFINILFLEQRSEAKQLRSELCKLREKGTKIYIASILPESELSDDFKRVTKPADGTLVWPVGDKACDLLAAEVSVRKQTDNFTNQAWSYCLNDSLATEMGKTDGNSKCQQIQRNPYGIKKINSAAYQIYLDLGNPAIELGNSSEMALTWGTERKKNESTQGVESDNCRYKLSSMDLLAWPSIIKGLFSAESIKSFCPYFNELTLGELQLANNRDSLINEQIVFYGYQLNGLNSFSNIPTKGLQHAMNVPAMALDNLLVYANNAKFNKDFVDSKSLIAFIIALQLSLILIKELITKSLNNSRIIRNIGKYRFWPKDMHFNSLVSRLALISISPILIFPAMWIGSGFFNLGVMGWIEYAAIGFLSEAIGIRDKIEKDLITFIKFFSIKLSTFFNFFSHRRYP